MLCARTPTTIHRGASSDEQAWAIGLSCGGTIEVFIEPIETTDGEPIDAADNASYATLRRLVLEEESAWVATRLPPSSRAATDQRTAASSPGPVSRLVLFDDGTVSGDLGDGLANQMAVDAIRQADGTGVVPAAATELETTAELFIERFAPQPTLIIVGAVHVAIHLIHLARRAGFRCVVLDARAAFATGERFPHADELHVGWPSKLLEQRRLHDQSYCVFLSHDAKLDDPALAVVLSSPARYVGALGSKRTHAKRIDSLQDLGVTQSDIERIRAPIGLDLGGRRPEEIAVSIVAQLVAARYDRLDADGNLQAR